MWVLIKIYRQRVNTAFQDPKIVWLAVLVIRFVQEFKWELKPQDLETTVFQVNLDTTVPGNLRKHPNRTDDWLFFYIFEKPRIYFFKMLQILRRVYRFSTLQEA